jgi:VanZ family protein
VLRSSPFVGRSTIAAEVPGVASRSRALRLLPPLIWAAVVIGVSSLEDLQTPAGEIEIRDKLAHFGEYFVFGWLAARAFDGQGWSSRKHFAWTFAFGLFLGAVDEFYQGFVPGRERSLYDLLADTLGAAAGWYFSREDQALGNDHGTSGHP